MYRSILILLALVFLTCCQTQTNIVSNVPGRDANEIVVLLQNRSIDAVKTPAPAAAIGGAAGAELLWNISVPSSQVTEALGVLNQAGLPRIKGSSLLELFGSQGLVPSDMQDRIRYQEGLSAQLATTIRKMDGIIDANVQITFPTENESTAPFTASVYVKHRGIMDNPNSLIITKIKRLVASALPGLTIDNVSVVADRSLLTDIRSDLPNQFEEGKGYTSVWGIILARDSLSHFRLVFYAFLVLIFILFSALAWLIWKFYPLINHYGYRSLLHPEPYTEIPIQKAEPEVTEEV